MIESIFWKLYFFIIIFFSHCVASGILVPRPEIKPMPLALKALQSQPLDCRRSLLTYFLMKLIYIIAQKYP